LYILLSLSLSLFAAVEMRARRIDAHFLEE
jgi:hypothetical protein